MLSRLFLVAAIFLASGQSAHAQGDAPAALPVDAIGAGAVVLLALLVTLRPTRGAARGAPESGGAKAFRAVWVLACLAAVGYYAGPSVRNLLGTARAASWPATQGELLQSDLVLADPAAPVPVYVPKIRYRYRVDGEPYESTKLGPGGVTGHASAADANAILQPLRDQKPLRVYVNPKDAHDTALLLTGAADFQPVVFGLGLFFLVGIGTGLGALRSPAGAGRRALHGQSQVPSAKQYTRQDILGSRAFTVGIGLLACGAAGGYLSKEGMLSGLALWGIVIAGIVLASIAHDVLLREAHKSDEMWEEAETRAEATGARRVPEPWEMTRSASLLTLRDTTPKQRFQAMGLAAVMLLAVVGCFGRGGIAGWFESALGGGFNAVTFLIVLVPVVFILRAVFSVGQPGQRVARLLRGMRRGGDLFTWDRHVDAFTHNGRVLSSLDEIEAVVLLKRFTGQSGSDSHRYQVLLRLSGRKPLQITGDQRDASGTAAMAERIAAFIGRPLESEYQRGHSSVSVGSD